MTCWTRWVLVHMHAPLCIVCWCVAEMDALRCLSLVRRCLQCPVYMPLPNTTYKDWHLCS
jgi:hypothetical protein